MENKTSKAVDRIVRVDVNDFDGNLLERWKAQVKDKKIGRRIILRLKELFNIDNSDIMDEEKSVIDDELQRQKSLLNT